MAEAKPRSSEDLKTNTALKTGKLDKPKTI